MDLLRRYWIEIAWAAFALANAIVLVTVESYETIPFHFIWVSLALVCAFRAWTLSFTVVVTVAVCTLTGVTLGRAVIGKPQGWDELTEVPLMALMFAVMVVHSRRRQEALEDLRLSTERERAFVRDASHQLRTPITVAQGHAELIRAASRGKQSGRDAAIVLDELNRLAAISDRLLLLASAEDPRFLACEPVDLEHFVRRAVERWSAAAERDWEVVVTASGTLPADEERLSGALDAVIENAVNATSPHGRIAIESRAEGDTAVIEVSDSGVGIPPDRHGQIFEPFSRIRRASEHGRSGTGLGLPMAKAIVEAHGGTIEVASEPGLGTMFSIRLGGFHASEPLLTRLLLDRVATIQVPSR